MKDYRKLHPDKSYKECLRDASKTYKKFTKIKVPTSSSEIHMVSEKNSTELKTPTKKSRNKSTDTVVKTPYMMDNIASSNTSDEDVDNTPINTHNYLNEPGDYAQIPLTFTSDEDDEKSGGSSKSPWIQHVKDYRKLHPDKSYKECMKEAKATYNKTTTPKTKKTKSKKVYVPNTFNFEEHLKFYKEMYEGGHLSGRDITSSASRTYIKERDSSDTIKRKLMLYVSALRGSKKRWTLYKGANRQHAEHLLEVIDYELETTMDLYNKDKDIGFTAQSNQPKSSKKKVKTNVKKPKVNKPKIKSEFLERINKGYEGGLNLKKENIVSKSVEDDTIILKLKDFTVDDGEEIDILKLVYDSKFDGFNASLIQTVEFNNKISEQEYDAFFIY